MKTEKPTIQGLISGRMSRLRRQAALRLARLRSGAGERPGPKPRPQRRRLMRVIGNGVTASAALVGCLILRVDLLVDVVSPRPGPFTLPACHLAMKFVKVVRWSVRSA